MRRYLSLALVAVCSVMAFAGAGSRANASVLDWTFASSGAGLSGSGQLTVDPNGDVTAFNGLIGGNALQFYTNPNFPGTSTLHGVPNTGGADFIYDDYVNPTPGINGITVDGLLISVGPSGPNQIYYDLSLDYSGGPADLFSINSSGGYVFDDGVFTTTTATSSVPPTPLPATWTMMLMGFAGLAFFAFRRQKAGLPLVAA